MPTITWLENGNTVSAVIGREMADLFVAPPTGHRWSCFDS